MSLSLITSYDSKPCGSVSSVLKYIVHAGAGHTGGSLSCLDILNVLYQPGAERLAGRHLPDAHRDRYVQSKGHSVEALVRCAGGRGVLS